MAPFSPAHTMGLSSPTEPQQDPQLIHFRLLLSPLGCQTRLGTCYTRLPHYITRSHSQAHMLPPHPPFDCLQAAPSSLPLIHGLLLPLLNSCHSSIGNCQPHLRTTSAAVPPLPRLPFARLTTVATNPDKSPAKKKLHQSFQSLFTTSTPQTIHSICSTSCT